MKTINLEDEEYPKNLKRIYNPPKQLYVMGDERILNEFGIGIVGTRKASTYGKEITKRISYQLVKHGINVISGMALGIDTEAHRGALLSHGKTIAVLGSGFRTHLSKGERKTFLGNSK